MDHVGWDLAARTILIVDDDVGARQAVRAILAAHDVEVLEAATGPEAIVMSQMPPDLILLDLGLPGCDGLELLHRLREECEAPIIVFSAADRSGDRAAVAAGAEYFLHKPLDSSLLLLCIEASLAGTAGAQPDRPRARLPRMSSTE
jgi:two-component system KDP operon response regulator KdpE